MLMCRHRAEYALKLCADASAKVCAYNSLIHLNSFHLSFYLQHGRHIESLTFVLDLEQLSMERHYYWPGIRRVQRVGPHQGF